MNIEAQMTDNELLIMALEIATNAICRQDGGINAGEDWRQPALKRAYIVICKEISRLENEV